MSEIRITEALRFDWSALRAAGSAENIPAALEMLAGSTSAASAETAYWQIDNTVVLQGALYEAAEATIPCALQALQYCTAEARPKLLALLFQLGGGSGTAHQSEVEIGNFGLEQKCRRELKFGVSQFFTILEKSSAEESGYAADLIEICSEDDFDLSKRAIWWLERLTDKCSDPRLISIYQDCLVALENRIS